MGLGTTSTTSSLDQTWDFISGVYFAHDMVMLG